MRAPELTLFAGPSAHGLDLGALLGPAAESRPPVRRGDIERLLVPRREPGVVVVCDGVFNDQPAVGHAELCRAIDAGWQVWGVSSLGAIRAFELRHEGMHGFGRVHALLCRDPTLTDDEMCLLHLPAPGCEPLTVALVDLRLALQDLGAAAGLDAARAQEAVQVLKQGWFGERTPERVEQVLVHTGALSPQAAARLMRRMARRGAKRQDLLGLLRTRPWALTAARPA